MQFAPQAAVIRRVRPGHWRALDRLAAGAYALLVASYLAKHADSPAAILGALAGAACFAYPIAWRRRQPMAAAALLLAAFAVTAPTDPSSAILALVPLAYVLYTVATDCRPRNAVLMLAITQTAAWSTALPDFQHTGAAVFFSVLYFTVWTLGYIVGMHRRYTGDLLRTQAELADAQLEATRRSVTEQRMLIARELHDVVAHHMTVITVQAGFGSLVLEDDPQKARAALEAVETAGRQTLSEMRRLLEVLHTEPVGVSAQIASLTPAPGLADLDQVVKQVAQAGVRVELTITGAPRALPAGVDLSAYRIVQEALTNVVKHAGTGTARARIDYRDDGLVIEVCDSGPGHCES
ncbi:sensor histidine kinase, partial [Catenulispora pinisilvae]|uniref:sensor histidine kinase n=1 Tax=Catenulispora pinisilvae TaxID=2705253 RepID=UPI00189143C8